MLDPDHFHKGDTPAETQAKRIALTWDINARYTPLFEEVLARPMNDPTRERTYNILCSEMKKEMDQRFAEAKKKPIIKPVKIKDGHQTKGGRAGLGSFIFNLGIPLDELLTCARPGCGKRFTKSKLHKKYCCHDCEERSKRDKYIQKRKEKGNHRP